MLVEVGGVDKANVAGRIAVLENFEQAIEVALRPRVCMSRKQREVVAAFQLSEAAGVGDESEQLAIRQVLRRLDLIVGRWLSDRLALAWRERNRSLPR